MYWLCRRLHFRLKIGAGCVSSVRSDLCWGTLSWLCVSLTCKSFLYGGNVAEGLLSSADWQQKI